MNDEGMLVRRGWLEKADAHITKQDAAPAPEYAPASRFYDIRPARLQTAWTQNQAGLWTATARFIVNDVVDDSFTFPVCAPTATSSPGGTAGTSRFFVVWRGRWEMIAGAGNGVSVTYGYAANLTYGVDYLSVAHNASTTTLDVITGVTASGNALYFTKKTCNLRNAGQMRYVYDVQ